MMLTAVETSLMLRIAIFPHSGASLLDASEIPATNPTPSPKLREIYMSEPMHAILRRYQGGCAYSIG